MKQSRPNYSTDITEEQILEKSRREAALGLPLQNRLSCFVAEILMLRAIQILGQNLSLRLNPKLKVNLRYRKATLKIDGLCLQHRPFIFLSLYNRMSVLWTFCYME